MRKVVVVLPLVPVTASQLEAARRKTVEIGGQIGQRAAGVFHHHAGGAGMFFFALRHDDGRAFFDGLAYELVAVAFSPAQRHEQAVPLHSPRVIRDTFHSAIKWPDDLADWNRGNESFELHEALA